MVQTPQACSSADRKIKGGAQWLYLVYHGQYKEVTSHSNKMASSKNARKITFSNALLFASGDFDGGSTTLSTSFSKYS